MGNLEERASAFTEKVKGKAKDLAGAVTGDEVLRAELGFDDDRLDLGRAGLRAGGDRDALLGGLHLRDPRTCLS